MRDFKFKRNAIVIEIIDVRNIKVKLENGKEALAIISSKQQTGKPNLELGQTIVILANPYETERVKVHKDSWGVR